MSITKILNDKDLSDADKLEQVAEIVAQAREAYGNVDAEIPAPKVNTTHGVLAFTHIEDESRVEILRNQAMGMKAAAVAFVEDNPGTVLNRKVQELLAINPFFANVASGTEFEYL